VEGRRAVRELLAAGRRRTFEVMLAQDPAAGPQRALGEIARLAAAAGVPVSRVDRRRLDRVTASDSHQGVAARAEPLVGASLEELCGRGGAGAPLLVVADGVTDPHNLGALLRSADFAGATGAVLGRHRAARLTAAATKAAAGAIEHLRVAVVPGIPSALAELSSRGVWSVGLDAEADGSLYELAVAAEPLALVLGSEGEGLGRLARERCDLLVRIPPRGATATLNVSVAAAVACAEVVRRRASRDGGDNGGSNSGGAGGGPAR
jgi:23S rRNA (guanosine2251-2'-O)-methyltransferase